MARGHYASNHYASRHYASYHYGGVSVVPPVPPPAPPTGGVGAMVFSEWCDRRRKKRRPLTIRQKQEVALTEVGNVLVPSVLVCQPSKRLARFIAKAAPKKKKRKQLSADGLILHDMDIMEAVLYEVKRR